MRKELLEGLTQEQIEKLRECKDAKEALELAKQEGIELNKEQLDAVSGGACVYSKVICPNCQSDNVRLIDGSAFDSAECRNCGHSWRL